MAGGDGVAAVIWGLGGEGGEGTWKTVFFGSPCCWETDSGELTGTLSGL